MVEYCNSCNGNNPHYEPTISFPVYCTILEKHISTNEVRKFENCGCGDYKDGTTMRRIETIEVSCPKCGRVHKFEDFQCQSHCKCGEVVWTSNTYCYFCGKITTGMEKECDNPQCLEEYEKVKSGD